MKIILLALFSLNIYAQHLSSPEFTKMVNELTEDFKVPLYTTIDLQEFTYARNFHDHFLLLDAREPEEYNVSHLPGAINIGYDDFDYSKVKEKLKTNKTIIVYCSVGYRSSKIAEKLIDKGHSAYNLYGGIFEWTNRNFPLVNNKDQPTKKIHSYSSSWGQWVTSGEKVH
jgi:rhodanese-related sulfurtransferase